MSMRCTAYCAAGSYHIISIYEAFKSQYNAVRYRDVVHLQYKTGDVFIFNYGSAVCWSLDETTEQELLLELKIYEKEESETLEFDEFTYLYGKKPRMYLDEITLIQEDETLEKLAVSHGLAQSVKLSSFEKRIEKTIQSTETISHNLATKGKIPLTRKEISQKIGKLFIERNSINLYCDILDTPEFFWEYPELEHFYLMTVNDLDIKDRTEILNRRLDIMRELFSILGDELNHRHSSTLEWIIIWLILIEVILTLLFKFVEF